MKIPTKKYKFKTTTTEVSTTTTMTTTTELATIDPVIIFEDFFYLFF